MDDAALPGGRYGLETSHRSLALRFDAKFETIEGVLALAQQWASGRGFSRDDQAGLRLLLEELLLNIRFHAASGRETERIADFYIDLRLEFLAPGRDEDDPGLVTAGPLPPDRLLITVRDPGVAFDPLNYTPKEPVSAAPGGRGLSLVRLFSVNRRYRREEGHNVLSLEMPLGGVINGNGSARARPDPGVRGIWHRLRAVWREKLALRQTVLFTVSAAVILWSGAGLYYATVAKMRFHNAEMLAMQSMATQDELSRAFLARVEGGLAAFARGLSSHPKAQALLENSDALLAMLRGGNFFRPFTTETPVIGIAVGRAGQEGAWFFHLRDAEIVKSYLPGALADAASALRAGQAPFWQGPIFGIPDPHVGRHAAMFLGMPLSQVSGGHWMGVLIGMPWIEGTLRGLSGFARCAPLFTNDKGEYVIYPPGRSALTGSRSFAEDAEQSGLPALGALGRRMQAGEKGLVAFSDGLLTAGGASVWPLPWQGASSLILYPMSMPGWRFAMAVQDAEIGNTLPAPPLGLILLLVLGPLLLGAVTWVVTSRTLRPLRDLASALENLGDGDLDTPFPASRVKDEMGNMLEAFERTRIILKASFRNQVRGATAQQRMASELALARSIQESMLPQVFPAVPGLDVAARMDMARDVCGDLYDCFQPDPDRPELLACVMGDVCGKGIPAALVMSRVMPLARSALLEGLSPSAALERINTALLRRDASGMFVTMLIGIVNNRDGVFTWASAGHPPPLPGPVLGGGESPAPPAWGRDLVLGVKPWVYTERSITLARGQSLLLYTDGADEAMGPGPGGAVPLSPDTTEGLLLYGEDALGESLADACREAERAGPAPASAILSAVRDGILRHMAGTPPFDDISLMVLKRGQA